MVEEAIGSEPQCFSFHVPCSAKLSPSTHRPDCIITPICSRKAAFVPPDNRPTGDIDLHGPPWQVSNLAKLLQAIRILPFHIKQETSMEIPVSTLLGFSRIRLAVIGIPLCVTGIGLIFYLKPSFGSTIRGLSVLTATIQALGALAVVLFFVALREYLKYKESLLRIPRTTVDKNHLLNEARKIGENCFVDTAPNPEHIDEWLDNARQILEGCLMDLMDAHPVSSRDLPDILKATQDGFMTLLESANKNREKTDFSLSNEEILALVPRVFKPIPNNQAIRKRLEETRKTEKQATFG